ncbi:hypothetical protein LPB87_13515 [Flavobacterium sp. EDS]|uniref:hypothetical protein n=1 Tax=Flavobacterium sp. EDS TaxID=2897328 RepID=UPI001E38487B|nr:hypothetical protein [Flavobacterium sp. EDS]MCD0475410.1 hypothetical protein [Flavobacterium sp. EDS]
MIETTTELAKNVIVDYKDVTSWILLLVLIVIGIVNYLKNISLTKAIETFKSDLTKKEFKFTRHAELQIECLKKMYDLVVSFHFSFTNLIAPSYKTHEDLQKNIESFQVNFLHVINYSHRNKILLTDEIVKQIRIIHEKFKKIDALCRLETGLLSEIEEHHGSSDPQVLYQTSEAEVEYIKLRIKKLNENVDVKFYEADIEKLRELIENYFKKLVA